MRRVATAAALAALTTPFAGIVQAQTVLPAAPTAAESATGESADGLQYDAAFFAQFAPRTALDMVQKVPGFALNEGDDRRGFAGSGGNVLIDGARPSAKSQSLQDALARIPASQVRHIAVIRNASGDAAGQGLVVNVVRVAAAGGGIWRIQGERNSDDRITPRGELAYSGRLNGVAYNVGINRFAEAVPLAGPRRITNGAGAVTQTRSDESPRTFRETTATGDVKLAALGGDLRLNASGGRWNFRTDVDSLGRTPAGVENESFTLSIDERQRRREIGGDWTRAFGPATVKLLALDTRRWYANDESTLFRNATRAPTGLIAQKRRNESRESIARATLTRTFGAHAFEIGGEGALNSLDANVDLIIDGAPIALPAGDVRIEETRFEAFIADTWTLDARWTIEARLAGETSTLKQTGDTNSEVEFSFAKPSLQISRKLGERDALRVRLFRDVGQLDFGDFASSAALADDRVAAGNPDLAPDSRWRLEAALDKRFGAKGALNVTVYREEITDVPDLVPVAGFDAPGNIGDGAITGVDVNLTAPLDAVWTGLTFTLDGNYGRSSVRDPLTGRDRRLSEFTDYSFDAELRRDDAQRRLAYGLSYDKTSERQFYRIGEIETYEEQGRLEAFVESTQLKRAKVRLYANNLANRRFERERRFFSPNRNGVLASTELRQRKSGPFYGVVVSGTF